MPTVGNIEGALFAVAPKSGAMAWDNVGLLVGDPEAQVARVLVALDITEAVADEAIAQGAQLIVAHHPVMNCTWLPVQTVRADRPQGRLLRKLICAGVSAICMHTNLDVAEGGVNSALLEALELVDPGPLGDDGIGRIGSVSGGPVPLGTFLQTVARKLRGNGLRYADAGKAVSRVAVGGGACSEYVAQALERGCDTFVTADLSYHNFLDAVAAGINVIDAGHFPTEDVVCPVLVEALHQQFPTLSVTKSTSHREVIQYYVEGE